MKKRFLILDGSSLMYRAFYALPLLESASGEYTNAIYGFSNMLLKLVQDWKPDQLVIAFDKGKKTFRTEMFPEYKGTRRPTPKELLSQIPILHEMAEAWGIPFIELAGYEADDIIGTLSNKAVEAGCEAFIVTGDRDALQLVKPDLSVLFTRKGISELGVYDVKAFEEEYTLEPEQLIDLKGLMGDASDNIPGVPGVGQKTAIKLLAAYGSVEQVILHIEEVAGRKLKERLMDNQELALLSKKLATICKDVPVDYDGERFTFRPKLNELIRFYSRYNIRSMVRNVKTLKLDFLPEAVDSETAPAGEEYIADAMPAVVKITTTEQLHALRSALEKDGAVSVIISYDGRVPHMEAKAVAIAAGNSLFYAEASDSAAGGMALFAEESAIWQPLLQLLQSNANKKYIHNIKSAYHAGISLGGSLVDLELAGYLLNPVSSKYDIPELTNSYLTELTPADEKAGEQELLGWQAYAALKLGPMMEVVMEEKGLTSLYWDMELPLVAVLAEMERNGIYMNRRQLKAKAQEVGDRLVSIEQDIYTLAGTEFNINSPKQLGEVLFDRLHLPVIKKTKTGYSTNAEVLDKLYDEHPIVPQILSYRLWTKLKSTYLDSLDKLIDPSTDRIHTSFNQTVTATGRLSSSDPNLQNIPVRTEEGKQIRQLFEPGYGYDCLLSADYSQIELRVLAAMSGDAAFIKAFTNNEDIHARTAAEVFGVPMELVTPEMRRRAKAVNFGIVYGQGDYGLSQSLKISRKEAASYIESYFEKCPGVKSFIDKVVADAHAKGYVLTKFNRRRELPAINSSNFNQRTMAERMAMNTPIQGTAADIIKLAMIKVYSELKSAGLKSRLLLQVHDELVLEVVEPEKEQVIEILKKAMEHVVELPIPLSIDINTGKNWADAK